MLPLSWLVSEKNVKIWNLVLTEALVINYWSTLKVNMMDICIFFGTLLANTKVHVLPLFDSTRFFFKYVYLNLTHLHPLEPPACAREGFNDSTDVH